MKKIFQILILAYFSYNIISKESTSEPFDEIDPPRDETTENEDSTTNRKE